MPLKVVHIKKEKRLPRSINEDDFNDFITRLEENDRKRSEKFFANLSKKIRAEIKQATTELNEQHKDEDRAVD
jgi:16S rRNA A1518/A1519 N6-dimethyltransferase RsmA/KsgA/DIM1 with predicted DNA glycosylase/AP lyase activity